MSGRMSGKRRMALEEGGWGGEEVSRCRVPSNHSHTDLLAHVLGSLASTRMRTRPQLALSSRTHASKEWEKAESSQNVRAKQALSPRTRTHATTDTPHLITPHSPTHPHTNPPHADHCSQAAEGGGDVPHAGPGAKSKGGRGAKADAAATAALTTNVRTRLDGPTVRGTTRVAVESDVGFKVGHKVRIGSGEHCEDR